MGGRRLVSTVIWLFMGLGFSFVSSRLQFPSLSSYDSRSHDIGKFGLLRDGVMRYSL